MAYNQTITKASFSPDHINNGDVMTVATTLGGNTDSSSNLQPYIVVYMFKRIS